VGPGADEQLRELLQAVEEAFFSNLVRFFNTSCSRTALVGAAMLSVLLFPTLAGVLPSRSAALSQAPAR